MTFGLPRWVIWGGLVVWAGLAVLVQTTLMAAHWYTLPKPDRADPLLEQSIAALVSEDGTGQWAMVHVLYSECRCSQRVFDHLFETTRPEGAYETVLLVGHDAAIEARADTAGFEVVVATPAELERRFGIVSAPLLLVLDPGGTLRYAGGYTERKQGYGPRDLDILAVLQRGDDPTELPLYGCGVSKELQEALDPMGIKYDRASRSE